MSNIKMKNGLYALLLVLFLIDNCNGSPLHDRFIRNAAGDGIDGNDGFNVGSSLPENANGSPVSNLTVGHRSVQSNAVAAHNNGQAGQSQGLTANELDGIRDQSNGLSGNHETDQPQESLHNGDVANLEQSRSVSEIGDQISENNQPHIVGVESGNNVQQPDDNQNMNVNIGGQGHQDADVEVGDQGGADHDQELREGFVQDGHSESGEHVMQSEFEHHPDFNNVESNQNETTGANGNADYREGIRELTSGSHSNHLGITRELLLAVPTSVYSRSQGRRDLPDNEIDNGHLLLDASLDRRTTTIGRVNPLNYSTSQSSLGQHQRFLMEPGEGINNRSQEIELGHGNPSGSNIEADHSHDGEQTVKESQNENSGPSGSGHESHEQPNENQNNNENEIHAVHGVTLSHGNAVPDEKHQNENNEHEVVLGNQNITSTTMPNPDNEHSGDDGVQPEHNEHMINQGGIDIPIDKGRYNRTIDHESIEHGHPRHTLILPQNTATFPAVEHLSSTGGLPILPTPSVDHEQIDEHLTKSATLATTIPDEIEHENGGSGANLDEHEGSGSINENTEIECPGEVGPQEISNHELEGALIESSGVGSALEAGNKRGDEQDKPRRCNPMSSNIPHGSVQSVSVTQSTTTSLYIEPTPTSTYSFSRVISISSSSSVLDYPGDMQTMQSNIDASYSEEYNPFMSYVYPSITDYETEFVTQSFEPSIVTNIYASSDTVYSRSLSSVIQSSAIQRPTESSLFSTGYHQSTDMVSLSTTEMSVADTSDILPTPASTYTTEFTTEIPSLPDQISFFIPNILESTQSPIASVSTAPMEVKPILDNSIPTTNMVTERPTKEMPVTSSVSSARAPGTSQSSVVVSFSSTAKFGLPSTQVGITTNGGLTSSVSPSVNLSTHSTNTNQPSNFSTSTNTGFPTQSTTVSYSTRASNVMRSAEPSSTLHSTTNLQINNRTSLRRLIVPDITKPKQLDGSTFTALPTSKKRVTYKATEKPETYTTTPASNSGHTSHQPVVPPSTIRSAITLATRPSIYKTTENSVLTTPPQVYLQILISMSTCQFCYQKPAFIMELQQLIVTQKQVTIDNEQFIVRIKDVPEEYCKDVPNNMMAGEETVDQITVEMYIVDKKGNIDTRLTYDLSSVIQKDFPDSTSAFKDKIVRVDIQGSPVVTRASHAPSVENVANNANVAMVIVLGSVGGCCCVILVILQVILIHRRVTTKRKASYLSRRVSLRSMDNVALGVIPKSRPNSGYWNPALSELDELYDKKHSHLLNFSELANFCMDVAAIHDEFQTIPFESPDSSVVPIGEDDKNRFGNVLPNKHTRVKLRLRQGDKSDYINANFIQGYKGLQRAYIATQSPLVNTVEDFWKMVWEQQSRVILMLNPVMSTGKPKQSTCYWPDDLKTDIRRLYGDFSVTLKKREIHPDYIECTLELMDLESNLKRDVRHFWLTCWPDSGTPEPLKFVKFILDSRPHYENSGAPAVVHCGPGQGRTGALIAVDMGMRRFEDKRRVDILDSVCKMRNERAGAVQNKEQYALIYQALNEYAVLLSSPSLSTRSSIITLHAML